MLVISRRPNEKIVFPALGITLEILWQKGAAVKIGIDAPPEIKVLRHELLGDTPVAARPSASHALCNQLNHVSLSLQLFERLRQTGNHEEADATLARVFEVLESMDRDWVAKHGFEKPNALVPLPRSRLRTLIVEDDRNERELLAGLLNLNGVDCQTATDGEDALDYLAKHDRPDLLLLDMWMPRCDGRQTLARIRSDTRLNGLKVFAVSGTRPDEAGVRTGPDGIDAWFPKPLNARKLWDAIRTEFSITAAN